MIYYRSIRTIFKFSYRWILLQMALRTDTMLLTKMKGQNYTTADMNSVYTQISSDH